MFDKTSEFARLEPETLQEEVLSEPESLKLTLEFIVLFLLGLACWLHRRLFVFCSWAGDVFHRLTVNS